MNMNDAKGPNEMAAKEARDRAQASARIAADTSDVIARAEARARADMEEMRARGWRPPAAS